MSETASPPAGAQLFDLGRRLRKGAARAVSNRTSLPRLVANGSYVENQQDSWSGRYWAVSGHFTFKGLRARSEGLASIVYFRGIYLYPPTIVRPHTRQDMYN